MPVDWSKYPLGWRSLSARLRFERAGGRCECTGECGGHAVDPTDPEPARCTALHGQYALFARRGRVVLTCAHLCTCEPLCGEPTHLKAMCQRCHLRLDADQHVRTRRERAFNARAVATLPGVR